MPSGPSLVVRILGDVSNFAKSVTGVTQTTTSATSRMHAGFSSMLGALNQTGVLGPFSGALNSVDQAMTSLGEHSKGIGTTMAGVGAGVAGVGAVLTSFGSKEQSSQQQLKAAIDATGNSFDTYAGKIDTAIASEEKFGHTSVDTQDALATLTEATHSPTEALTLLNTATDLAAAKHESLNTAADSLGKVYNGNTRILKEFGIQVAATVNPAKELASAQKAATTAAADVAKAQQNLSTVQADLETKTQETAVAQASLQNAEQNVTVASQAEATAHGEMVKAQAAVAQSSDQLTRAKANLSKTEKEISDRTKLTATDLATQKSAEEALTAAIAGGDPKAITAAKKALTEVEKELAAKVKGSTTDHNQLKDAQDAVKKATEGHTAAISEENRAATAIKAADNEAIRAKQQLSLAQARVADQTRVTAADQAKLKDAENAVTLAEGKQKAAAEAITKAHNDAANAVNVHKEAIDKLAAVLKGQASASADTFTGKLDAIKAKVEDQVSLFGEKYGPAISAIGIAFVAMGSVIEVAGPIIGAAIALGFWPLTLIVASIAAIGVAIYELYTHWNTVWGDIKAVAEDVWNWITNNWPYLVGILLGPFGIAAAAIWQNFDTIKKYAQDAYDGVTDVFTALTNWFKGLGKAVSDAVGDVWHFIASAASTSSSYCRGPPSTRWSSGSRCYPVVSGLACRGYGISSTTRRRLYGPTRRACGTRWSVTSANCRTRSR